MTTTSDTPDPLAPDPLAIGGDRVYRLLFVVGLAAIAFFHLDAIRGTRGPFLADSVEYVMMAREIVTDEAFPLKPVRSVFFSLLLAAPMYVQRMLSGGATLDHSTSIYVLHAFTLLALLGTFRLGAALGGRWSALLAVVFLGLLPEFTLWSVDTLTDVPAAACGVWALVFWIRRRFVLVGLALGTAVALRYQSLIPMAAFLAVPFVLRRWRDLALVLLGVVPPLAVLGAVDWAYWGTPFHTLLIFVPRQLTTFLPLEWVQTIFPVEAVTKMKSGVGNAALESIAAKSRTWYLEQAPLLFTWPVVIAFFLAPFAGTRPVRRPGRAMTLWVLFVTLLVLSVQRYKETRYLVAIAPFLAALAATGAVGLLARLANTGRTPRRGRAALVPALVAVLLFGYGRTCWRAQSKLALRPFEATLQAVESIPPGALPCSVATAQPWILVPDYPVKASASWHWYSTDLFLLDIVRLSGFFALPDEVRSAAQGNETMEALDYYLINMTSTSADPVHFRWLNERTVFDGYFHDPRTQKRAAIRLRRSDDPDRERPFWVLDDRDARDRVALGSFTSEVAPGVKAVLAGIELTGLEPSRGAIRVDSLWRLSQDQGDKLTADFRILDEEGSVRALDRIELLPDDPLARSERAGAAFRARRYLRLFTTPVPERLRVEVRVGVIPAEAESAGYVLLDADGPRARNAGPEEVVGGGVVSETITVGPLRWSDRVAPLAPLTPDG